MNDFMQQEFYKNSMGVQVAKAKELNKRDVALDLEYKKFLMKEIFLEKRKAQYDEVVLSETGGFEIVTRNLTIDGEFRDLCNFCNPQMKKLVNEKNADEIFQLSLNIGSNEVFLYLAANEVGNSGYLLKKFSEAGCEIYARNRKLREEYLHKIFMCLLNRSTESCTIPCKYGWNKLPGGRFKFVKRDTPIWKEVWSWTK